MSIFTFWKKPKATVYKCPCCGKVYSEVPLCFGTNFPDYIHSIPPEERATRVNLMPSLCVVDKEHFFHRGRLTIPIHNYHENFVFNAWTSISADNFAIRVDNWTNPERNLQGPYFGWLNTMVPSYGDTINLKTMAHENGLDLIPSIQIIEENHPLTLDQTQGISYKKALTIVEGILRATHQGGA